MSLAPTVIGINVWLLWHVVPLWTVWPSTGGRPNVYFLSSPLAVACLWLGRRLSIQLFGQILLLLAFPVLLVLPEAIGLFGNEASAAVWLIQLIGFLVYLGTTCNQLASSGTSNGTNTHPKDSGHLWEIRALSHASTSRKWKLRAGTHLLLGLASVAVPALLLYAICLHPAHTLGFVRLCGSPEKAASLKASLMAGSAMLWSSIFYFCVMRPLRLHIDHDSRLRHTLSQLSNRSQRGRLRPQLVLALLASLIGLGSLFFYSL